MNVLSVSMFKLLNLKKKNFVCPICNYNGPFKDVSPTTGLRKHAACPKCGALERHRLQCVVLKELSINFNFSEMSIIHIAPEPFFQNFFQNSFKRYISADLCMKNVDYRVDLQNLPFKNNTYDCVFASHVLEHIKNDKKAISEIHRILKPDGIAILPVPIVANKTIEYPEPNPYEAYHVRSPGYDYYDKYMEYFSNVEKFCSNDFPEKYQLFIYEDRTHWPNDKMPLRDSMEGEKHIDIIPVCCDKI
jgi:SAM-dependent methyltransferase